jgi:hypothetical protein
MQKASISARPTTSTSPYLLATKLEAFRGRGDGDFAGSTDIEDIILIIDGRPSVLEEVRHADAGMG